MVNLLFIYPYILGTTISLPFVHQFFDGSQGHLLGLSLASLLIWKLPWCDFRVAGGRCHALCVTVLNHDLLLKPPWCRSYIAGSPIMMANREQLHRCLLQGVHEVFTVTHSGILELGCLGMTAIPGICRVCEQPRPKIYTQSINAYTPRCLARCTQSFFRRHHLLAYPTSIAQTQTHQLWVDSSCHPVIRNNSTLADF